MGMPKQEWAIMWPNSPVFILFIPRTFPQSFIKIWWTKFEIYWKRCILGPKIAQFEPKWWACPGKNGLSCDQTLQSSFFLYQEHPLNVSSKSDEPNSRYIGRRSFWTRLSQLPRPLLCFLPFFLRTRFFPDMRFSQILKGHYVLSFGTIYSKK